MDKVRLVLGIHNHQPEGNFPEVMEQGYQQAYLPFMEVMERHPSIKWCLHASGILWNFIADRHPEYVARIKGMSARGQLELLSGGFFEPILPVIPERDRAGQISLLTEFIRRTFETEPKGMWLAERVWEPSLAFSLARAGMKYTVVDDMHFAAAGYDADKLRGYYTTEDQGEILDIFPISRELRYHIPFQTVEKTIEYLISCRQEGASPLVVMADDGEKFGMWPETYRHVYLNGWLDHFLSALEDHSDRIETVTFSGYREQFPSAGRVYLPTASYSEMAEWALPPDAREEFDDAHRRNEKDPRVSRFLRGGFWRTFLARYEEANTMHKKMLMVSRMVETAVGSGLSETDSEEARKALYAGQCNCAYWHGVFGGLYLPHLRQAIYRALLKAENTARKKLPAAGTWQPLDIDKDGREEMVYLGTPQNLFVAPHAGGSLFEWDLNDSGVNLQNVLTRRKEMYHRKLRESIGHSSKGARHREEIKVKEQNLERYLQYDWYRRSTLLDHFLHPGTKIEGMRSNAYGEQGDFILGCYGAALEDQTLILTRQGAVWEDGSRRRVDVEKRITPVADGFTVVYRVTNREERELPVAFAPEFNCAFSFPVDGESGEFGGATSWQRIDRHFGIQFSLSTDVPCDIWAWPCETVSLSEGGFERTYQGTVILPVFRREIPPLSALSVWLTVNAAPLGK